MSTRETYCRWVINALRDFGSATPQQVYHWIRLNEAVPDADLIGLTSDGKNLFEKNVRWARFTLRNRGFVSDRMGRGIWSLEAPCAQMDWPLEDALTH